MGRRTIGRTPRVTYHTVRGYLLFQDQEKLYNDVSKNYNDMTKDIQAFKSDFEKETRITSVMNLPKCVLSPEIFQSPDGSREFGK
jgi:hypothetical protein